MLFYPKGNAFFVMVIAMSLGVHMYKRPLCIQADPSRSETQKYLGYSSQDLLYFDIVLSMGLTLGDFICQRVTSHDLLFMYKSPGALAPTIWMTFQM